MAISERDNHLSYNEAAERAFQQIEDEQEWDDSPTSDEEAISIQSVQETGEDLFGEPI
ncbi:hypothetical protein [Spirosoma areae]